MDAKSVPRKDIRQLYWIEIMCSCRTITHAIINSKCVKSSRVKR